MLWLISVALAQDPAPADDALQVQIEATTAALTAAEAELATLRAAQGESAQANTDAQARIAELEATIAWAATMSDRTQTGDARSLAAMELAQSPDGLPFLAAAAVSRDSVTQRAALDGLASRSGAEAITVLDELARSEQVGAANRWAIDGLEEMAVEPAGRALLALAGERNIPKSQRQAAYAALERSYSQLLAAEAPAAVSSTPGAVIGTAGNGLAGGILLSSVGVWGRNNTAITIGALGGSAVGLGTGVIYSATQPVTLGDGLRYTSNVGWGLAGGVLATEAIFGRADSEAERRRTENYGALFRVIGVGAGATTGLLTPDPQPRDVVESNIVGLVGTQLGIGLADRVADGRGLRDWNDCWDGDEDSNDCDALFAAEQRRYGASLGGAAALMGVQALVRDQWEPEYEDYGMSGIIGIEGAIAAQLFPGAFDTTWYDGRGRIGGTTAGLGGAALAHFIEPDVQQVALGTWGGMLGHGIASGASLIPKRPDDQLIYASNLAAGPVGLASGLLLSPKTSFSSGDLAMLGVGTGLIALETAALVPSAKDLEGDQRTGVVLFTSSAGALALSGVTQLWDPRMGDMFFLGSTGAWGAWYGGLVPIALNMDGSQADWLRTMSLTGDAFIAAGALGVYGLGYEPKRSLLPQLGGVTGATLGALPAAMISGEGDAIAAGAVIGSIVGIGGGVIADQIVGPRKRTLELPYVGAPDLSKWSFGVMPQEEGVMVSVQTIR